MIGDASNGYDDVAEAFIARRGTRPTLGDAIGASTIRAWAAALPAGATVLDIGAGPGEPSTRVLREVGLTTFAIDASPTMVAAFRVRFPGVPVECDTVEASDFFRREFDGVLAWGLMFLLEPDVQALVIRKIERVLHPRGRFLFTAPRECVDWLDAMTGRRSRSLGAAAYERLLHESGMALVGETDDEGENHYYWAEKVSQLA